MQHWAEMGQKALQNAIKISSSHSKHFFDIAVDFTQVIYFRAKCSKIHRKMKICH